jgi:hypothetical protein
MNSSWFRDKKVSLEPVREDWPLLLTLYAAMVLPAVAMALVEGSPVFAVGVAAFCGVHAVLVGPQGRPVLGKLAANVLAALLLLVFAARADLGSVRSGYMPVHFIISLQLIKLFGAHRTRDLRVIQFISLFELLVAARWARQISFLPVFALAVLVLLLSSMMLATRPNRGVRCRRATRLRDLAAGFRLPGLLLLVFTVVCFVAFPRFRLTAAAGGIGLGRRTGFTKDVSLQEIGNMRESHNVALRARFSEVGNEGVGILAPRSLMRGTTYTRYEDGRWSSPPVPFIPTGEDRSQFAMEPRQLFLAAGIPVRYIRQNMTLEASTDDVLFGLYVPLQVDSDDISNVRIRNVSHQITRPKRRRLNRGIDYEVLSVVPDWPEADLARAGTPDRQQAWARYWQYPERLANVLQSAIRTIERQYQPTNDLERIRAVESYLGNPRNFSYSIDLPAFGDMDPVDAFLTETRVGSCEQFASTMVLLLRAWGIPSRLVGGYKGGTREEESTEYVFRDSDAHAWVEVFFNDHGWVEFDPTPGSASTSFTDMIGGQQGRGLLERLRSMPSRLLRQAEVGWNVYVFNYGADQQSDMLDDLREAMAELSGALPGNGVGGSGMLSNVPTILGTVVALFVMAVGLHLLLGITARRRQEARRRGYTAEGFYGEMLRLLKGMGVERSMHTTPREFARRARSHLQSREPTHTEAAGAVQEITDMFCRARYGGQSLNEEERTRISHALQNLREAPSPS